MRIDAKQAAALRLQLRRSRFSLLSRVIGRALKAKRLTEKEVLKDFARWKKTRRRLPPEGSSS
jgi:hypothetical protein